MAVTFSFPVSKYHDLFSLFVLFSFLFPLSAGMYSTGDASTRFLFEDLCTYISCTAQQAPLGSLGFDNLFRLYLRHARTLLLSCNVASEEVDQWSQSLVATGLPAPSQAEKDTQFFSKARLDFTNDDAQFVLTLAPSMVYRGVVALMDITTATSQAIISYTQNAQLGLLIFCCAE